MNQSRCCAKESGSGAVPRRPARAAAPAPAPVRAQRLHPLGQRRRPWAPRTGRAAAAPPRTPRAARDDHLRRQQRVAAQLEEVVLAPPRARAPSTSAQIPASTSSVGVRGATYAVLRASGAPARGSARRSSLPLAVSGSASSTTKARRHHVLRQPRPQVRPQLRAPEGSAPPRRPRRPPARFSPGASSRTTTTASRTAGVLQQRRLDLARLDAEAAHLDLGVDAAQELQLPVGQPAHPVARAVQPRPRLRPNGSGTKRSAVSSGRPR